MRRLIFLFATFSVTTAALAEQFVLECDTKLLRAEERATIRFNVDTEKQTVNGDFAIINDVGTLITRNESSAFIDRNSGDIVLRRTDKSNPIPTIYARGECRKVGERKF